MTRAIILSAAVVLGSACVGFSADTIVHHQYFATEVHSTIGLSGPVGIGSINVGPIMIDLSQSGYANGGLTSATQTTSGMVRQFGQSSAPAESAPEDEAQVSVVASSRFVSTESTRWTSTPHLTITSGAIQSHSPVSSGVSVQSLLQ